MEISKELQDAINDQLNFELYSGYIYLSMAAYFESLNYNGMAKWMKIQASEEYAHAMRFWNHITDRGGRVVLTEIKAPATEWDSPLAAWENAYEHEKIVTERIFKIGKLAEKLGDKSAIPMLNWFYDEQVEEEEQTSRIADLLKQVGDNKGALFMLDGRLGQREK
ncbi:MAG: ferritin [Candidatus Hermodarchaeia archaeon]|jgi:ferritin